jgi:3-hydroxyisobutyrate dehydrogenase-like beta-hydroxyacid dehydrogenase
MRIGFIGLGRMGSGLARNLLTGGYSLGVYDLSPAAVARLVEVGANEATSARALAQESDVLFTSLPLPSDVESVLLGETGCAGVLPPDATVIDVSTIDPLAARRIADAITSSGRHFLACPLGKGPAQAAEGTEPIFAGGPRDVFDRCRQMLEAIGTPVYYLGDVEQSTAFKLLSNLVGLTNMAVLAEGLAIGVKAGIEMGQLLDLLGDTGADSYQLRLRGPWVLHEEYAPRFSVDLTAKDLRLAVAMARAMGVEPQIGAIAFNLYSQAQAEGYGAEDAAAVFKLLCP